MGKIYGNAARVIAFRKNGNTELMLLLKAVKGTMENVEWDYILMQIVEVYVNELRENKTAEKFITKMIEPENQIKAYVMVGKYKSAYVIAAKNKLYDQVAQIRGIFFFPLRCCRSSREK